MKNSKIKVLANASVKRNTQKDMQGAYIENDNTYIGTDYWCIKISTNEPIENVVYATKSCRHPNYDMFLDDIKCAKMCKNVQLDFTNANIMVDDKIFETKIFKKLYTTFDNDVQLFINKDKNIIYFKDSTKIGLLCGLNL